jgi:hypothetical protein
MITVNTRSNRMVNWISLITFLFLLFALSCVNEPTDNDPVENKWQNIPELSGMDIWDVKIHTDEIFVAGRDGSGKGIIYKSSDAIHWEIFAPSIGDSVEYHIAAIDFYNGELIASTIGKPVYLVTGKNVVPLTVPIFSEVREMIVDNENNILIGASSFYTYKYVTENNIYDIYDSLSTPPTGGCFKQNAIVPIGVSKFLKDHNSNKILIGNYAFTNHFVNTFYNRTIDCFPDDGLNADERFFGCHDIIFINDTLFAAGWANIKYLDNYEWKTFGDSLPRTPGNGLAIATSIAFDEIKNEIYVAATYIGVIKWTNSSGWISFNERLESVQGLYDFMPDITYFKGILLLTYGTSKSYQSGSRGARYYSLK